jgi:hypothetical protein
MVGKSFRLIIVSDKLFFCQFWVNYELVFVAVIEYKLR